MSVEWFSFAYVLPRRKGGEIKEVTTDVFFFVLFLLQKFVN
jgi:hypothetical protein